MNVAYMYATIYYSYYEETELQFLPYNKFYRRLIDNALIIVDKNVQLQHIKKSLNNFGPIKKCLTWTTEPISNSVNLLDLTITSLEGGTITYKAYQNLNNFFLYRYYS